ncbi:MAG TPA: hypothetical protein VM347_20595 [Nonomuraea sp.]|nr:hypothetical protein [Nonomuraea sp.]
MTRFVGIESRGDVPAHPIPPLPPGPPQDRNPPGTGLTLAAHDGYPSHAPGLSVLPIAPIAPIAASRLAGGIS